MATVHQQRQPDREDNEAGRGGGAGLAKAIKDTFGFNIDVTVRTDAQLRKVLANNPYPDGNPSQVTVAFLMKAPDARAKERVTSMAAEHEPLTFAGRDVYVNYSHGLGTSKLAEKFSSIVGVSSFGPHHPDGRQARRDVRS